MSAAQKFGVLFHEWGGRHLKRLPEKVHFLRDGRSDSAMKARRRTEHGATHPSDHAWADRDITDVIIRGARRKPCLDRGQRRRGRRSQLHGRPRADVRRVDRPRQQRGTCFAARVEYLDLEPGRGEVTVEGAVGDPDQSGRVGQVREDPEAEDRVAALGASNRAGASCGDQRDQC